MSTNDNTGESRRSRRGFLRATATGATAAGLGASATGTATAQDDEPANDSTEQGTDTATTDSQNATAGAGGHGGGEGGIVFTPELQAMGAAIVLGVLSPIAFAIMLVMKRDEIDGNESGGRADTDLKRIE